MKAIFKGAGKNAIELVKVCKKFIQIAEEHNPGMKVRNHIRTLRQKIDTNKHANVNSKVPEVTNNKNSSLPNELDNKHKIELKDDTPDASITGKDANGNPTQSAPETPVDGDPISLCSGEELLSISEGKLLGILPVEWSRFYRTSASEINKGLGYGWSHSLSHYLTFADDKIFWSDHENKTTEFPALTADTLVVTNKLAKAAISFGDRYESYIVTFSNGQGKYHFEREGSYARLVAISDKYNNTVTVHYTSEGYISHIKNDTCRIYFSYNSLNLIEQVALQRYESDNQHNEFTWVSKSVLARYEYNSLLQLACASNGNNEKERYEYDDQNVIISRELSGGAIFHWQWEGEGKSARCIRQYSNFDNFDTQYEWNDETKTVKLTRSDGSQQVYQHDSNARLIYEKAADGAETFKEYDDKGQLVKITDPLGKVSQYFYDDSGNVSTSVNPDRQVTNYVHFLGAVKRVSVGEGKSTKIWLNTINQHGEIVAAKDPSGCVTRYSFYDNGKIESVTYPDGVQTQYLWDSVGRLVEEKSSTGALSYYRYDDYGVNPVQVEDESGNVTLYQWDSLGRLLKCTYPDGRSREYQYNPYGKVTQLTDEAGRITAYEYAAPLHLLTHKTLPDGSVLKYRYNNIHLQVSEIENQKGEVYQLRYTATGLISEEIGFDNIKTTYAYDLSGHLIEKCEFGDRHDEEPFITQYVRDPMGRLLSKILPDGTEEQYSYDDFGQLTKIKSDQQLLVWEYDIAGRLTAEHQNWATIRHRYHEESGKLSGTRLPDGQWLEYHHRDGQLRGMTLDSQPLAAFDYNNGGRERERRQGNGLINRYQYDDMGRLSQHYLREGMGFDDNPQILWKQDYRYQADNELSQIIGNNPRNYGYDDIGQLISSSTPDANQEDRHAELVETFSYDPAGNRVSGENSAAGNRLAFFGDRHFEYDRFGNLIAERRGKEHKLLTTYEYDCRHRLIKHTSPNGRVSIYSYDAFNRRTSKTVEGKKTEFIWQGSKLIAECSDKDTVWRSYLYEPGSHRPLVLVEGNAKKNQKTRTFWYQNDHLGTPHSLTDSLGALVYSCTYNAYGQVQTETQHQQQERGLRVETNLRFQGQYADEETGLFYNLNRYYDPGLGRYLTADPIRLAGGLNQYRYCSNPTNWVDPFGLFDVKNSGINNTTVDLGEQRIAPDVYSVDSYYNLRNAVKNKDLGLDAHHVGQKAVMKDLVDKYDPDTAPSILVPKEGHTRRAGNVGIVSRNKINPKTGLPFDSARDLIARDVWELRRVYSDIPNLQLKELINMSKRMYPEVNVK